jgi:hypothetical protein
MISTQIEWEKPVNSGIPSRASMSRKPLTSSCLAIDLRRWVREQWLLPQTRFLWRWRNRAEALEASIVVRVGKNAVELVYKLPIASSTQLVRECIPFSWSTGHLGGRRRWFQCPGCGRRVAILYLTGTHFRCRMCGRLAYESQYPLRGRSYGCLHRML